MPHPLQGYLDIVAGKRPPRFRTARSLHVPFTSHDGREEQWRKHRQATAALRTMGSHGPPVSPSLLDLKVELARPHMNACRLCPWSCGADRGRGVRGRCGVLEARVSSDFVHLGEEAPLVPSYTIFFAGCNLQCAFCQNYDISTRPDRGDTIPASELGNRLDRVTRSPLRGLGRVRNLNWVGGDPTPDLPYVLEVLRSMEASVAQVWNSNMYITEEGMALLDGVMDLYLTDLKFGNDACARRVCGALDYTSIVHANHLLAAEQGEVLVRHLLLPGHLDCCTLPIIEWLADSLPGAAVNLMDQYRPEHKAGEHPELLATVLPEDYRQAVQKARELGLFLL